MKIKVIIPNVGMARETLDDREVMLKRLARPDTQISVDCISAGPESIESCFDEVLAAPEVVHRVARAEREGFDAAIVYCFSDPGVDAAREMVSIPVIGPGEASVLTALALGTTFSVVTVLDDVIPRTLVQLNRMGTPPWRVASVRGLGIPVSRLRDDLDRTFRSLVPVARKCRDEDGAHVIVLACLGMAGLGARLQEELGMPVVDPAFVAVAWAEWMVALGLRHSRFSYPQPSAKLRIGGPKACEPDR